MMAVLELPPRLACSILVSLLSLKGTWLLPCTIRQQAHTHTHPLISSAVMCCDVSAASKVCYVSLDLGPAQM